MAAQMVGKEDYSNKNKTDIFNCIHTSTTKNLITLIINLPLSSYDVTKNKYDVFAFHSIHYLKHIGNYITMHG